MRWMFCLLIVAGGSAAEAAPLVLQIDAREAPRRILHARLTVPVSPGKVVLVYPKWLPGEHGPVGAINDLVGLQIKAGSHLLPWQRDPSDLYAFEVNVPDGVKVLEVAYDYVSGTGGRGAALEANATDRLLLLKWNHVLLYPRGIPVRDQTVEASVRLPSGWRFATALSVRTRTPEVVRFAPVSVETLVDSPLHAGLHQTSWALSAAGRSTSLHVVADSAEALAVSKDLLAAHGRLVDQARILFGAQPFARYEFLLALSDGVPQGGLEHHESSDNRVPERYFLEEGLRVFRAGLLPHELVHAWNGKFRRPADLVSEDYQRPVKTELLWVYEGLTSYLGDVLAARSGLRTVEQAKDAFAASAALLDVRAGRNWRSLNDTAVSSPSLGRAAREWRGWRRGLDYYSESALIWLEADVRIREKTDGKRSLDDFCRAFFGGQDGAPSVKSYGRADVVAALRTIADLDWEAFFAARVNAVTARAPVGGLEAGGWKLGYRETPTPVFTMLQKAQKEIDLSYGLGFTLGEDGVVIDVVQGAPAALAGIAPTNKIIGVNGRKWNADRLHAAVKASRIRGDVEVVIESGDFLRVASIKYRGGGRYPVLERIVGRPDRLGDILAPSAVR